MTVLAGVDSCNGTDDVKSSLLVLRFELFGLLLKIPFAKHNGKCRFSVHYIRCLIPQV